MSISFDESKYYLGRLCKRSHNYSQTGKSLYYKSCRKCLDCNLESHAVSTQKKWAGQSCSIRYPQKPGIYAVTVNLEYSVTLLELVAELQVQFKLKGYSFLHPRVKAWMQKAGVRNQYWMEHAHYEALIKQLEKEPHVYECNEPVTAGLWRYQAGLTAESWPLGSQFCVKQAQLLESQMSPDEIESDRAKWAAMPSRQDTLETAIAKLDSYHAHLSTAPKPKFDPTPKVPEKPLAKPVPKSIQEIVERCKARANAA